MKKVKKKEEVFSKKQKTNTQREKQMSGNADDDRARGAHGKKLDDTWIEIQTKAFIAFVLLLLLLLLFLFDSCAHTPK